jgi:hypothetical protein
MTSFLRTAGVNRIAERRRTVGSLQRVGCLIGLLAALAVGSTTTGAQRANGPAPAGIYDDKNNCINDETSLPAAPSVAGDQFVVRSEVADEGVAKEVAGIIRTEGMFGVYEKGLGISSLLQPGQPGPFPVFVVHDNPNWNGITAKVCNHPTWLAIAVKGVIATYATLVGVVAHELFHAAQGALLKEDFGPTWWFEATATAAGGWFAPTYPLNRDPYLIDHPDLPMDTFDYTRKHQYGAYLFVRWLLNTSKLPDAVGWTLLRDSIEEVKSLGPDAGIDAALAPLGETFGGEIASFWANHTNPQPTFGPTAPLEKIAVSKPSQLIDLVPRAQYAARLDALQPVANNQQLELIVHKLPAGVELWVNLGNDSFWRLQPGHSLNETFCRSGYTNGTFPLPVTGDVRLALTTTGAKPPAKVEIKALTTTTHCPKQYLIVPGFGIGPLHLGMSIKEANSAATLAGLSRPVPSPLHDGSTIQFGSYSEGDKASVITIFRNGRLALMGISANRRFITTTGITTFAPLLYNPPDPWVVSGSTKQEFEHSGKSVSCTSVRGNASKQMCAYEEPKTRYTFAASAYEHCTTNDAEHGCNWPAPDLYVSGLGVATDKGWAIFKVFGHRA